jgi:hypothetical protein
MSGTLNSMIWSKKYVLMDNEQIGWLIFWVSSDTDHSLSLMVKMAKTGMIGLN